MQVVRGQRKEIGDMSTLKIGFLDVGHGDFIYATTPLGDNV